MKKSIFFQLLSLILAASLLAIPVPAQAATIVKSGTIVANETWTTGNVYQITGDLVVANGVTLTIQAGVVVKVLPGNAFDVDGKLTLQGTSGSPVVFTSNRDNSYGGDTDPGSTPPAATDWKGLSLNFGGGVGTTSFQYVTIRYATTALYLRNLSGGAVSPSLAHNRFEFSDSGLILDAGDGDITSLIQDNYLYKNTFGLQAYSTSLGMVLVDLQNNFFEENSAYPLVMFGNSFPSYSGNTFSLNGNQGIAVGDLIDLSNPWVKVPVSPAPGAAILPYVVDNFLEIAADTILQIPAGLVIKFGSNAQMSVSGKLELLGVIGEPVVFTSFHDDDFGGDTDGVVVDPATDPWSMVDLIVSPTYNGSQPATLEFQRTIYRYSSSGLGITNGSNVTYAPNIHDNTFELNGIGVNIFTGASGDTSPVLNSNTFIGNEYAVVAAAGSSITGDALPAIQSNLFQNQTNYPIALQGSVFPTYSGNSFSGNTYPAIAIEGTTHRNGSLPNVPGQGGGILPYVLKGNYSVGKGYTLSLPTETVVKSGGPALNVNGTLNLQSMPNFPVVFTSLKDDSYGGNTDAAAPQPLNQPAPAREADSVGRVALGGDQGFQPAAPYASGPESMDATPQPGNWAGIAIYSSGNNVHDAIIRYASFGVRLVNLTTSPISATVERCTLENNQNGVNFEARFNGGNISATVIDNQIVRNGSGVRVQWDNTYLGLATPVIHNNNIMVNSIGVENQQSPQTIDATGNYWGHPSGPYHSTNPLGLGDRVSNYVLFNPFLSSPPFATIASYAKNFLPVVNK